MKTKYKVFLTINITVLVGLLFVAHSYALWVYNNSQTANNVVTSGCLDIVFDDDEGSNAIHFQNTYPVNDEKGLSQEGYTFTITNVCTINAKYTVTLNTRDTNSIWESNVKVAIHEDGEAKPTTGVNLLEYGYDSKNINTNTEVLGIEDLGTSYIMASGTLKGGTRKDPVTVEPGESKTYHFYAWLDENAENDVMDQTFEASINIIYEAYTMPKELNAAGFIEQLASQGDSSLRYDGTKDNNLRYIGKDPNNYIALGTYEEDSTTYMFTYYDESFEVTANSYFESLEYCKEEETAVKDQIDIIKSCDLVHRKGDPVLWRIIGVMNNIEGEKGKGKRLKLVQEPYMENTAPYSMNVTLRYSAPTEISSDGMNEWSTSELMKILNDGYSDEGLSVWWNSNSFEEAEGSPQDFRSTSNTPGLNSEAKQYIEEVTWHTGTLGTDYDQISRDASLTSTRAFYDAERSSKTGNICAGGDWAAECDTEPRYPTWTGKVGMPYPSDYGFATSVEGADWEECVANTPLSLYEPKCTDNNWLAYPEISDYIWFMTPVPSKYSNGYVFSLSGAFDYNSATATNHVFLPTVYLDIDTKIVGGDGSKAKPYEISFEGTYVPPTLSGPEDFANEVIACSQEKGAAECVKENKEIYAANIKTDDTADENIRYFGAEPQNYIDLGDRDESGNPILWRIIGVMNQVPLADEAGKEDLLKVIRADSIGDYSWDSSRETINYGYGTNEWSTSAIMNLLNPGYTTNEKDAYVQASNSYETRNINNSLFWDRQSGECYVDRNAKTDACSFQNNGLSETAKTYIQKVTWNTGTYDINSMPVTMKDLYEAERSEGLGKQCPQADYGACNDKVERHTTFDGFVGLMYPSDYGFATDGGKFNSPVACLTNVNWQRYNECAYGDWLYNKNLQRTITPSADGSQSDCVESIYGEDENNQATGLISGSNAGHIQSIRPAVYLKKEVKITGGNGTKQNPFTVSL